ncbi:regulatory LuxR family protein [Leucobacter luti]|uniref:Regulatory LuxR family protein n=1 Tax=Leucobacter luti TaxID=340320 RepID=A0A4V6MD70_9MICO|nr:regulatory LuxR family protein [Leucobacter luti]
MRSAAVSSEGAAIAALAPLPSRAGADSAARASWAAGHHVAAFGDPGSGRTVFAERLLRAWPGRVHRITGSPALREIQFAALAALTAHAPDAGTRSPTQLIAALAAAGDSGERAVLLDDADYIDDASAAALAQAALSGSLRLLILGTSAERLPASLRAAALEIDHVRLEAITLDDARVIAEAALGTALALHDVDRLRHLAGSNARYLRALVLDARDSDGFREVYGYTALREGWVPNGRRVGELISLRLSIQPAPVREAVLLLALTGEVPVPLAERLATPESVRLAVSAGLAELVGGPVPGRARTPGSIRVCGGLTSPTVLARVPEPELRTHAEHALRHTEEMTAATAITVAIHASQVGVTLDATRREAIAGEALRSRQFDAALLLTDPVHGGELSDELCLLRSRALFESGLHDDAHEILAPMLAAGDLEARVWSAKMSAAFGLTDALDATLAPRPTDEHPAPEVLAAWRDVLLTKAGGIVPASALRAHADSAALGSEVRAAALQSALLLDVFAGQAGAAAGEAIALMSSPEWEIVPLTEQGDLVVTLFQALLATGSVTGDLAGWDDDGWAALRIMPTLYLFADGRRSIEAGNAKAAADLLHQALAANGTENRFGIGANLAAATAAASAMLGDVESATELRDAALQLLAAGGALHDETERLLLPAQLLSDGPAAATAHWHRLRDRAHRTEQRYLLMRVLHDGWRLGLHEDLAALSATAAQVQGPLAAALAQYANAAGGDGIALERAVSGHLATGHLLFAAELTTFAIHASRQDGRRLPVSPAMHRSLAALAELRGVNTPIMKRVRIDRETLTEREFQVCAAAVSGSSNSEIADLLFLSTRTVEGHLQRAFGKLGVDTRGQLAPARL